MCHGLQAHASGGVAQCVGSACVPCAPGRWCQGTGVERGYSPSTMWWSHTVIFLWARAALA